MASNICGAAPTAESAVETPAAGTPAAGTPAAGTPAAGTPAAGTSGEVAVGRGDVVGVTPSARIPVVMPGTSAAVLSAHRGLHSSAFELIVSIFHGIS